MERRFGAAERSASDERNLLTRRAVCSNDLNRTAPADAVEALIGRSGAHPDEMHRTERRERVGVEPFGTATRPLLVVEVAPRILIRGQDHRRGPLAGINRRVELFYADAGFEHAFAADDDLI